MDAQTPKAKPAGNAAPAAPPSPPAAESPPAHVQGKGGYACTSGKRYRSPRAGEDGAPRCRGCLVALVTAGPGV